MDGRSMDGAISEIAFVVRKISIGANDIYGMVLIYFTPFSLLLSFRCH